jgi:hypothetical protein
MKKILDIITQKMEQAFAAAGYDASFGRVTVSNRPDLCQYQCNGALAAAKQYKCAPIAIANAVAEKLDSGDFAMIEAVMPGFINLNLSDAFLTGYLEQMRTAPDFGVEKIGEGKTVVVDYGGANVAKPLHIGHLRPAIIGESLKRLHKFLGYNTIGDVHLGDWGLQIGLIIAELQQRQPELPYFDESFTGDYPEAAPFTVDELEEIYPRVKNWHISVKEVENRVIFLRKLCEGGVAHSFGIHVARLAGMPQAVIDSAQRTLNMLEKKEGHSNEPGPDKNGKNLASKKKKSSAADNLQLSFFQLEDPLLCDLRDSIKAMDINSMSPLDAFDAIRKLKEKLGLKK